ncbi:hypothetical protein SCUCBS95973_003703 [Sporothrix curviconia]|uniref:FAD-binding domain-containing protein n=1 Tax=Sporothrix curviconia TaxID=1260050 RepID=A0ABP0BIY5_9PEZI
MPYRVHQRIVRDASSKLNVIVVGAGLGGLGAAIAILLAGHDVTVLESASTIGEVGAGIQVLPNSARVLFSWGLKDALEPHATMPRKCNFISWKGQHLSEMDYHAYAQAANGPFMDFHRANLHKCLLDRAVELGAKLVTSARVDDVEIAGDDAVDATVVLADGRRMTADLVVGADGIHSRLREVLVGHADPPELTGDLAYRLLLPAAAMLADPELRALVQDPQVNYWVGPDAHAVNYVLRGGELFNMVLLVPDDMPAGASTIAGSVAEMRDRYQGWDPRITKLLALCDDSADVTKWRLCIRPGLEPTWSHPSAALTLLGDAVHATLPYLASGAGMALEDAGVLGLCLARITANGTAPAAAKRQALAAYEACRRERTERVVARGSYNQHMYHLHDGPEQEARDQRFREFAELDRQWMSDPAFTLPVTNETGEDPFPWRYHGVGRWLLTYDMEKDLALRWPQSADAAEGVEAEGMVRANI